jgi:hypothetical protein
MRRCPADATNWSLRSMVKAVGHAPSTVHRIWMAFGLPHHAIRLHGAFVGFPSDHLGMEVQVSVMPGTPKVIWAAPQPSARRRFGQSA